jgi:Protein of unknown function (DUF2946)
MDAIVAAALKKWPHVPHCFGWLALDARGDWYMRDDRVRAAGPFPQVKGSRIRHDKLLAFIGRNYGSDEAGRWFFQNGPQRVYVELEAAPWVWRLNRGAVATHTGEPAEVIGAWLDEAGRLFLHCDRGFGLVHTLDMADAAEQVEAGRWLPRELPFAEMPARFGYCLRPDG